MTALRYVGDKTIARLRALLQEGQLGEAVGGRGLSVLGAVGGLCRALLGEGWLGEQVGGC